MRYRIRYIGCMAINPNAARNRAERGSWSSMVQRCTNPKRVDYARYGAAGVAVCDRWRVFGNFLADMGRRPTAGHSLDRIDSTKGYEPGNVRWATAAEQNRNRKTTRLVEHMGRVQCASDWAQEIGVSKFRLLYRLRQGWTVQQVLDAQPCARSA